MSTRPPLFVFQSVLSSAGFLRFWTATFVGLCLVSNVTSLAMAQGSAREWVDSTGRHKVSGTLIEVKDENVYLKTPEGKTLNIPINRLSKEDQAYVKSLDENPFKETSPFKESNGMKKPATKGPETPPVPPSKGTPPQTDWTSDLKIDWEGVEELARNAESDWSLELPKPVDSDFTPKRASLNKKLNFHEGLRRLLASPATKRAVAGYTVSFSVPKPLSRLALVDLASGKSVHTDPVECDMCPLCILQDGTTVLMQGTGDERSGHEVGSMLQLWKVGGKKVSRSPIWIPFPNEHEHFGTKTHAHLVEAVSFPNNRLVLLGNNGHLACVDAITCKPYWHTRLSQNHALCASDDGKWLAVVDGHAVMIVDPQTGQSVATKMLEGNPHMGWTRVRWSPSGEKLLITFISEGRVLDLKSGEWIHGFSFPNAGPIAPNALAYPHDDYALLNNTMLVHLPTQIRVCEYQQAAGVASFGKSTLFAVQSDSGGALMPIVVPHPSAEKILTTAKNDPKVFLIHPGVKVAIDASGAGEHAARVTQSLEKAAQAAGYEISSSSPIRVVGSITGPKQEAVSYIAAGSYIANVYQSTVKLTWNGKDLWQTGGNNVPGMMFTSRDESIQDKLNELGKTPNFHVFETATLPKLLQRPKEGTQGPQSLALLVSNVTMAGLVDNK
jgi:hypothetical protein